MKSIKSLIIILSATLFVSCAHTVPKELVDARQAYQHASRGPAAQLVPAELHKAQEALAQAERSFSEDPRSDKTKSLAYIAQRKAEKTEAMGNVAAEKERATQATKQFEETKSQILKEQLSAEQQARLDAEKRAEEAKILAEEQARLHEKEAAEQELTAEQKARLEAEQGRQAATEQLTAEQQARLEAEKRAEEALSKLAEVKEEPRGLVITLSGGVFFASNQATLLPPAQTQLSQVAEALMATKERSLIVEGHTDSRGSASYNKDLAQRRAEVVRDYLASRGYPAQLIVARGIGMEHPVADNATAEGRANNRRVEIIIEPEVKR